MRRPVIALALAILAHMSDVRVAKACGCLSPPLPPPVGEGDYAVNQSAEQIVFEVEPNEVTAHILIRYQGNPAQFAWLIPVPVVPDEMGISPSSAFGLLDQATQPQANVQVEDLCPQSQWACHVDYPSGGFGCGASAAPQYGAGALDAGVLGDAGGGQPPVTVINQQTVGDYQTVTFRASEASAAVQWLHDNGFIVNDTTSIYMESYIQANFVFVAAKLVPGAGITAIKPLKIKYQSAFPMVPLILTAVAAQPNLTVNAFIYSTDPFKPQGHPVVSIDGKRLANDPRGRFNYPMVLARTIDEAGGDAFAIEYRGFSQPSQVGTGFCCTNGFDTCGIGNNGQCECPGTDFDASDCATQGDLNDGVALLEQLGQKYPFLTRITTRISPEEMTFDPTFEPDPAQTAPVVNAFGQQASLDNCTHKVIDQLTLANVNSAQGCAAMYCGTGGECVETASGGACACNPDMVAQRFVDLDGQPSVTCVPRVPPVDLRAGGNVLPDACANISCGAGECIDRNGIAVCACNAGDAAVVGTGTAPSCVEFTTQTHSPGADNFTQPLRALAVCAPAPPSCGDGVKYDRIDVANVGVDCGDATPAHDMQHDGGGGCQPTRSAPPFTLVGGVALALAIVMRRRRA